MAWWDHEELKSPSDRSDRYKVAFPSEYSPREVQEAQARLDRTEKPATSLPNSTSGTTSTSLKRYWLFAGPAYYPDGGMSDFIGSSDEIEPLRLQCLDADDSFRYYTRPDHDDGWNWYHIFDSHLGKVIEGKHQSGDHDMKDDRYHFTVINGEEPAWPTTQS